MSGFQFQSLFELAADDTPYRLLTRDHVRVRDAGGPRVLQVDDEALDLLTFAALRDISHLFRPGHLQQ
jgi:fumarate hydratase, class I